MERGNQLREDRWKLTQKKETIEKRLKEIESESATLANKIAELKREDTNLSEIVRKGQEGAQPYRVSGGGPNHFLR